MNVHRNFIHKSQKVEPTHSSSTGKWYIHIVEYYLAVKGNKVLSHATTQMNLENVMPSERKTTNCVIPII